MLSSRTLRALYAMQLELDACCRALSPSVVTGLTSVSGGSGQMQAIDAHAGSQQEADDGAPGPAPLRGGSKAGRWWASTPST